MVVTILPLVFPVVNFVLLVGVLILQRVMFRELDRRTTRFERIEADIAALTRAVEQLKGQHSEHQRV